MVSYKKIGDPIERSQQWVREQDASYDREMYRWVHSQPGGNCDINREIFRLKYPKDLL